MESPEKSLVPYQASRFAAASTLVLAPHPDDEVFGCGGAIASLLGAGGRVHVLVLTDGAGWENDAARRREIAALRMSESRQALHALGGGCPESGTLESAPFEDRLLSQSREPLAEVLLASLRRLAPDLVLAPSPVEVHPDHRAAADALLLALSRLSPTSLTVAFYEVSQPIRPNFLLDVTNELARKDAAMAAFGSQNDGHDYPAYVRGLNAYRRMTLPQTVKGAEGYFVLPASQVTSLSISSLRRLMGPDPELPAEPASLGERLRFLWTGRRP